MEEFHVFRVQDQANREMTAFAGNRISDMFPLSRLHPCHLFSESPNSRACQNPQALR